MTTRILHVISSLRLGGAQTCLKAIAENLPSDEYELYIFPLRSQKIDIPINAKILTCPCRNYDPRKFLALLRFCKEYQIDILHAHLAKPILASLLASFFRPVKVIVHEHGPVLRQGWEHTVYRFFLRLLRRRITSVVAVSQVIAKELQTRVNIPAEKIHVLYNPVDLDRFHPAPDIRGQMRERLSLKSQDMVIGFTGRLSRIKGPELLLQALAILLEKSPAFHLIYLGDGAERAELQRQTQKMKLSRHVQFLGFQADPAPFMSALDLGLIPSRHEPLCMVALEYMAMNIPIICSGVQGLSELVEDQVTGFIPPENTGPSIAQTITQSLSDPQRLSRITANAYEKCRKFALPEYIQKLNLMYKQTANANVSDNDGY